MLGYEIGVMSCGYEMFVTKCPSYDMCGNQFSIALVNLHYFNTNKADCFCLTLLNIYNKMM